MITTMTTTYTTSSTFTITHARHIASKIAADLELWVAEGERQPLAFLGLQGDCIDRLYVDPAAQGRGIGLELLDHAKALRPGGLWLFTHQKNAGARRFYERHGFRILRFGISPAPESEPDLEYAWRAPRRAGA